MKASLIVSVLFVVSASHADPVYRPGDGPIIIHPTYRPPPSRPFIIRTARDTGEPQWLYQGDNVDRAPTTADHPYLPHYIDDIKLDPNRRYARSVNFPDPTPFNPNAPKPNYPWNKPKPHRFVRDLSSQIASFGDEVQFETDHVESLQDVKLHSTRVARSLSTPSVSRGSSPRSTFSTPNSGTTHTGYNRRIARSVNFPDPTPFNPNAPKPNYPWNKPKPHRFVRDLSSQIASFGDEVQFETDHVERLQDVKLHSTRVARSLSTPSVSRGSSPRSTSTPNAGMTHPGYNRRNARSVNFPDPTPFNPNAPKPNYPWNKPKPHRFVRDLSSQIASFGDETQFETDGVENLQEETLI